MRVYRCNFQGRYPVGAAAVVVANNKYHAKEKLESKLAEIGLEQKIPIDALHRVATWEPSVTILCDGDY